jgi:hypothetical protein
MTKRIGIAAVFLVGCAVGGGASQLVVPKASAQQAATLTKWEYHCTAERSVDDVNKLGPEGWEMVGMNGPALLCFKRPKM